MPNATTTESENHNSSFISTIMLGLWVGLATMHPICWGLAAFNVAFLIDGWVDRIAAAIRSK